MERYTSLANDTSDANPRSPALSSKAVLATDPKLQQQQQQPLPTSSSRAPVPTQSHSHAPSTPARLGGLETQTVESPSIIGTGAGQSQSQSYASPVVLPSPVTGSTVGGTLPISMSASTDSLRDGLHLSGHEPRYFPGMVSRSQQRKDSMRQGSVHESDK